LEFTDHLKTLFSLHDCIIIPGLGGFVAQHKPATINKTHGKIHPPVKSFYFDDSLVKDNGLLVSFVADALKISQEEARHFFEKFSGETRAIAMKGSKAELVGLGYFYRTVDDRIDFHFEVENNFDPETAGCGELHLPFHHEPAKPPLMATESHTKPTTTLPVKKPAKHHHRWIVPLAAAAVVVIALIIAWPSLRGIPFIGKVFEKTGIATAKPGNVPPPVILGPADTTTSVTHAVDTSRSIKRTSSQSVKPDAYANCSRFYIIAGSFRNIKRAEELSSKLTLEGFKTDILSTPDGWNRVSVMFFTKRDQALKAMDQLKAQGKLKTVWLLSI